MVSNNFRKFVPNFSQLAKIPTINKSMKQLLNKQLAMLLVMLFTSLGSAFGYNITVQLNYNNAVEVNFRNVDYSGSYFDHSTQTGGTINVPEEIGDVYFSVTIPTPLYSVNSIKVDGNDVTADWRSYGICRLSSTSDHTVNVELTKIPVQEIAVSFNVEDAVSVVLSSPNYNYYPSVKSSQTVEVPEGDVRLIINFPSDRYYVVNSILVDGVNVTSEFNEYNGYQISSPGNHTVDVEVSELLSNTISLSFQPNVISPLIRFFDDNGLNVDSNNSVSLASGKNVKMKAMPMIGYEVDKVEIRDNDGNSTNVTDIYLANGYYEFAPLSADYTVIFEFKQVRTHKITASYDSSQGQVSLGNIPADPENGNDVNDGSTVRLEASTYDYRIEVESIVIDGTTDVTETYRTNGYYDFTNVTADHNVVVTFKDCPTVTLTYNTSLGNVFLDDGWISSGAENAQYLRTGSVVRLEVRPFSGYKVGSITVNGTSILSDYKANHYYDLTVNGDCEVNVTLEEAGEFQVQVNYTEGGQVGIATMNGAWWNGTPIPPIMEGSELYLYIVPSEGFVPTATIDGEVVALTYVFENQRYSYAITSYLEANVDVRVTFNNIGCSTMHTSFNNSLVEVLANGHYLWPDGERDFTKGSPVRLTIRPSKGYEVESVSLDNTPLTADENGYYDFVMPDDECYLSVTMQESNGIATGIGFIWAGDSAGKTKAANTDDVYNLQGQKMNGKTLKPGIYIRNGKKFMVK